MQRSSWHSPRGVVIAAAALMIAQVALAHHSFVMFDRTRQLSRRATVKELEWTNPHCWLHVWIADDRGGVREWRLEAGPPGMLTRTGWSSHLVKPGEPVTVTFYPMKDGSAAGDIIKVVLPDGRVMGPGGAPGPPPAKSAHN